MGELYEGIAGHAHSGYTFRLASVPLVDNRQPAGRPGMSP